MTLRQRVRRAAPVLGALGLVMAWRAFVLASFGPLAPMKPSPARPGVYDYRGAIHVHSDLSHDGRAPLQEIVEAARETGLDFVYLTEHNNFGYAARGQEGWKENVLLLGGEEAGPCDAVDPATKVCTGGHLLLLGPTELPGQPGNMKSEELAELVNARGGLAIAAHPTNRRSPWRGGETGLAGVEIANTYTGYQSNHWGSIASALLCYPFNPLYAMSTLMDETAAELAFFDKIAAHKKLTGIGGADAHACIQIRPGWKLAFPPMRHFFRLMSTHLLLQAPLAHELEPDKKQILGALRDGRVYVSFDCFADPRGFSYTALIDGTAHPMGSIVPLKAMTLRVTAPEVAGLSLALFQDGRPVARADGPELVYRPTEEGAYRAVATLELRTPFLNLRKQQPWILSNPVFVGSRWSAEGAEDRGTARR